MDYPSEQPHGGFAPVEPRRTSGKAIASLILGIFGVPFAVVGLILGIAALKEIDRSGGTLEGRGLAIAGIIVSLVTIVISLIALLAIMGTLILLGRGPVMEPPYDIDKPAPSDTVEPEDLIPQIEEIPFTQSIPITGDEYAGITQHYAGDARMTVIRFADKGKAWMHCLNFGADLRTEEGNHVLLNVPALQLFDNVIFPHSFVFLRDSKRRVFAWTNDKWFFSIEAPDKETLAAIIEASEFISLKKNTDFERSLFDLGGLDRSRFSDIVRERPLVHRTPQSSALILHSLAAGACSTGKCIIGPDCEIVSIQPGFGQHAMKT